MKTNEFKILIIDDEEDLCEILQFNLENEGYAIDIAYSAEEALKRDIQSYSLILLDVMMGQMSGYKFANKIRKELKLQIPIIFITAKTTENDLLTGFSIGGDDYITKPFSIKEVIARVKAILLRTSLHQDKSIQSIKIKEMVFDFTEQCLLINNNEIQLTKKEFEILTLLVSNSGKVFSRKSILDRIWHNDTIVTDRTIDVHIARLRKKIDMYGKYLVNKQGFGYMFKEID